MATPKTAVYYSKDELNQYSISFHHVQVSVNVVFILKFFINKVFC